MPVPLVSGMNIAKKESYLLETVPIQYSSINASSVAPKESGNTTIARSSNPAITALIIPRGATAPRLDVDDCPLSGTRVVMVISIGSFVPQSAAQCALSHGNAKGEKRFFAAAGITQNGAAPLAD